MEAHARHEWRGAVLSLLNDRENAFREMRYLCDKVRMHASNRVLEADTQSWCREDPQVKDLRGGRK